MTRLRTLFVIVFLAAYTLVAFADKEWNGNIPAPNSVSGLSYWIWADGVLVIDSQSKVASVAAAPAKPRNFCTQCGAKLAEDSVFCENCGAKVV